MSHENTATIAIVRSLIATFWSESQWTLLLAIFVTLAGATTSIAAPYIFSRAIDQLINNEPIWLFILYAILFGSSRAFGQAARYLVFLCAERLGFIIGSKFFARLLRKTPDFFLDNNPIQIGNARQEGTQTLSLITQLTIGGLLPGIIQIIFGLILLGSLLNWETAVITGIYGAFVIGFDYVRVGRVSPFLNSAVERSQENAGLMGNAVSLIDTIRQTKGEVWITGLFTKSASAAYANWRRYALASSVFCGAFGAAATVQLAVTFLILVPRYKAGELSVGDVVLFNTLLLQLNEPFHLIGMTIKETAEATARFQPLAQMWKADEDIESIHLLPYNIKRGKILFANVNFKYPNGRGIDSISFTAEPGVPTFITGETGSGKSTVLKLLLRTISPSGGQILVDDMDLTTIKKDDWFSFIGVVPQDIVLLNNSLTTNIVLGRPFDIEKLHNAARRAAIYDSIQTMPEGFDTIVGERGLKLSGGERQRIAIARALYSNPRILILDEATAALDTYTEQLVISDLRKLSNEITIISVTHRCSIITPGDNIINI